MPISPARTLDEIVDITLAPRARFGLVGVFALRRRAVRHRRAVGR
jgi:hypothetical protein